VSTVIKSFVVPVPGEFLNMNDRRNRFQQTEAKNVWRDAAFWWAKQYRLSTRGAIGVVEMWIEFGVNDPGRRRDPHNWYPTVKAICDGFTHAVVWADDDSEHLRTSEPTFVNTIKDKHLRITLTWETADAT
jgi:Holliday junction resolvase RusA-like endonuclease